MAPVVLACANVLAAEVGSLSFLEVSGVRGVADVIFVTFDPAAVNARTRAQVGAMPEISPLRCLLALAEGASTNELAARAGVSRDHLVRAVLPRLAESGWVVRHGRSWKARAPYLPLTRSMVAVELKRYDWRGALRQASKHAESADASWVVLDALRVRPAIAAAEAFRHAGVGLASVAAWPLGCMASEPATLVVHIDPTRRDAQPHSDGRALLSEQCLSLWLAGESSGPTRHVFGQLLTQPHR